jgi:hypothetical protein
VVVVVPQEEQEEVEVLVLEGLQEELTLGYLDLVVVVAELVLVVVVEEVALLHTQYR